MNVNYTNWTWAGNATAPSEDRVELAFYDGITNMWCAYAATAALLAMQGLTGWSVVNKAKSRQAQKMFRLQFFTFLTFLIFYVYYRKMDHSLKDAIKLQKAGTFNQAHSLNLTEVEQP